MYRQERAAALEAGNTSSEKINPRQFIAALPAQATKEGLDPASLIVATDVGQHQMWTAQFYPIQRPRQLLTSGSLGTMGFGLPTALGAAMANPGSRVLCFTGDGSIMMNIQELATMADNDIDVKIVLLHNSVLGMVYQWQKLFYGHRFSNTIMDTKVDFVKLAEAMGIKGVRIESLDGFDAKLKAA